MTGADAVSHFYGRSKKAIYEKVRRSTEAQLLISNLGKHVVLPDIKKCSTFLVKFIYDDKSSHTIAEARAKRWRGTKNKTTLRLAPDEDSFIHLLELWPSGIRRRARDPMVVSSKPRSDISVEVTSQC